MWILWEVSIFDKLTKMCPKFGVAVLLCDIVDALQCVLDFTQDLTGIISSSLTSNNRKGLWSFHLPLKSFHIKKVRVIGSANQCFSLCYLKYQYNFSTFICYIFNFLTIVFTPTPSHLILSYLAQNVKCINHLLKTVCAFQSPKHLSSKCK